MPRHQVPAGMIGEFGASPSNIPDHMVMYRKVLGSIRVTYCGDARLHQIFILMRAMQIYSGRVGDGGLAASEGP